MDYIKIHNKFIEYFRTTQPRERITNRNATDFRLSLGVPIYTEVHHITPRSLGGLDVEENLVRLLPEEHVFMHMLRYRAFGYRQDMLAVRFCVNGIASPTDRKPEHISGLTKAIRSTYSFIRTHSYNFRREHGWQTIEGRQSISDKAKNTMPVKSSITGELIGYRVSTSDPRVVSGEFVHHSTGMISVKLNSTGETVRVTTDERSSNNHLYSSLYTNKGEKNSNYSGVTDADIVTYATKLSNELGRIASYAHVTKTAVAEGVKIPKSLSTMRFGGNKIKGYVAAMKIALPDLEYLPNFKSDKHRANARAKTLAYNNKRSAREY